MKYRILQHDPASLNKERSERYWYYSAEYLVGDEWKPMKGYDIDFSGLADLCHGDYDTAIGAYVFDSMSGVINFIQTCAAKLSRKRAASAPIVVKEIEL